MHIIRTRQETLTSSQTGRTYALEGLAPDLLLMDLDLMFIPKGELAFIGVLGEGAFGKVMSAKWKGGGGGQKGARMSGLVKKDEVVAVKVLREQTDEKLLVELLKVILYFVVFFALFCLFHFVFICSLFFFFFFFFFFF